MPHRVFFDERIDREHLVGTRSIIVATEYAQRHEADSRHQNEARERYPIPRKSNEHQQERIRDIPRKRERTICQAQPQQGVAILAKRTRDPLVCLFIHAEIPVSLPGEVKESLRPYDLFVTPAILCQGIRYASR